MPPGPFEWPHYLKLIELIRFLALRTTLLQQLLVLFLDVYFFQIEDTYYGVVGV